MNPEHAFELEIVQIPLDQILPIRVIVGRLDPIDFGEGPERLAMLPQVGARAGQALDVGGDRTAQRALEVCTHGCEPRSELLA